LHRDTEKKGDDMSTTPGTKLTLFMLVERVSGERHLVIAVDIPSACQQAGVNQEDVIASPAKPTFRKRKGGGLDFLVSVPTRTCPYQYAACKLPADQPCTLMPYHPDLHQWLKSATAAHLCQYTGVPMFKDDHALMRKWVTMEEAIALLSRQ